MKPFDTINEAKLWLTRHALGNCEVYVWTTQLIMGLIDGQFE